MKNIWNWLNKPHRLEEIIINRDKNNFDIIRHLAALIVIYQHCYFLNPSWYCRAFGVPVFFFLSGLLVSQSFEASSSAKNFVWKRFLRIYPAAIVVILICALVMGPLITAFTPDDYFKSGILWKYISSIALLRVYFDLPGVFQHSPLDTSVNISLWTLPLEIKMYLFTLVWGLIKLKNKNAVLAIITLILIFIGLNFSDPIDTFSQQQLHFTNFKVSAYTSLGCLYLTGTLCYWYRHRIVVRPYWLFVGAFLFLLFARFTFYGYLFDICIVMITLGFSVLDFKWLRKITQKTDLSYGLYIYGFPVEQLFINYVYPYVNGFVLFVLIVSTTFFLAFLSWNIIEKRPLQFKLLIK
jgi:peptidoglycan/LPS O-acetylase OafA/YrhL